MPDITMCRGDKFPNQEKCYRYMAIPSKFRQSYFAEQPVEEDGTCEYFKEMVEGDRVREK